MSIFRSHEGKFTVACVRELHARVHVPLPEMQNVRVAIELAVKCPSHLERGKPEATVLQQPQEVQHAQATVASVETGLRSFELHPKSSDGAPLVSGLAHFDHLVRMARRSVRTGTDLMPSAALNIEYSKQQQGLINPKPVDYAMHEIAKHAHGEGAKQCMARRKLDNLGYMRAECVVANDPDRIRRLKKHLHLTESLAAINKETADVTAANASLTTAKMIEAAPAALDKLKAKGGDLNKITMPEMCAIAFKNFKGATLKGNKAAHMKELAALIEQQPSVLALSAPSPAAPIVGPPPLALPVALNEEESGSVTISEPDDLDAEE